MKKLPFFMVLQLVTTTACFATTLPKDPKSPQQFSLGLEFLRYQYREPGLMEYKGFLYGADAAYNYTFANNLFFQPDVRFVIGRPHYKSKGTGSMKSVLNWLVEPRLVFGHRFKLTSTTELDPYFGVGYRFKSDHSNGRLSTTGHSGYHRRSHYLYIPIGLTLNQQLAPDWFLSPTAEFDWFLRGWQQSYLSKRSLNHSQKKGYGLKGDLMLTKKFSNSSLSIGPFVNYWNIKQSNIIPVKIGNRTASTLEPHNKTLEVGVKVNYIF